MSTLSPGRWREISPYLDEALTLDGEARTKWLAALRERDATLAEFLTKLLDEHVELANEEYLERPASALMAAARPGHTAGAYRLVSTIGLGGMSTVWLAERSDGRFEGRAAVKFLNFGCLDRVGRERFTREGSILGRLQHPHIAHLMDAGVTDTGSPYLVLEYIEGEHIDQYCDRRRLDVQARIGLFLDVLAAVEHAHANLIVHRDIKPSNVLVTADGQVKLLDFGIAKLLEGDGNPGAATQLTREGSALSPLYAAPEQLTAGVVNTATDVYTLGVLLHVLLTGRHPAGLTHQSTADLVKSIVDSEPANLSDAVTRSAVDPTLGTANARDRGTTPQKLGQILRGDLDTIARKALKKNSHERYGSVAAFADDLRRYLRYQPISARPDTVGYRTARFVRRNRMAVALSSLVCLATVAGVTGTVVQARTARRERDFAVRELARAERINYLNYFLITDAAPSGKRLNVDELLPRAERIIEHENYSNDPASHVELLISIGMQYFGRDDVERSRRVLEQAYQLSAPLHEPSQKARAACALTMPFAKSLQYARAESLFQEGLREIPSAPEFALDRAFCLVRGSNVATIRGSSREAIARAESAERALRASPFQSDNLKLDVLKTLAAAHMLAGRYGDSIAAYEQASRQMSRLGYDETRTAGLLLHDWAFAMMLAGQPYGAEKAYRRAIDITRAAQAEGDVLPALLVNYAGALRNVGRLQEAADYAERAYARAKQVNDQQYLASSLTQRARIYRDQHDFTRAASMLAELEPLMKRLLPPNHYMFASLASEQALLAEGRGDLAKALELANGAVALDQAAVDAGGQGAYLLPTLLVRRSEIELMTSKPALAEADAARAVTLLHASALPFSMHTGRALLALSRAFQAQGRSDQAQSAARSAAEQLERALGPDHPETRDARQRAGNEAPTSPSFHRKPS